MENVVTNEFVEKCNNELKVFNTLSLHEKVSFYLKEMEKFALAGQTMLHRGELASIEEDDAMGIFVENFFDAMSMFEDNDLPSESPFAISEQELKENYEVIFDSIREISYGFSCILSEMDSFRFELKPYEPSVMEKLFQMKNFSIVDKALILEIDELED